MIQSIALSKDGKVIAVAKDPECNVSENRSYYDFGTTGAKFDCSGGQLSVLKGKGELAWTYPNANDASAQNETVIGAYDVDVSQDGRYIVASVSKEPCHEEAWRVDRADRQFNVFDKKTVARFAKKGTWNETLLETWDEATKDVTSMICKREVVLFNAKGKPLWKHPARGIAKLSPDGKFVMVIPYIGWLLCDLSYANGARGSYIYANSWYLFSVDGKKLLEKKVKTDNDAHAAELLYQDKYTVGPFSEDGRYFIFANSLYQVEGGLPQKLNIEGLPSETYLTNIAPGGVYALAISSPATLGKHTFNDEGGDIPDQEPRTHLYYLIDIPNQKVLWAKQIPQLFRGMRSQGERANNNEPYLYDHFICPIRLTDKYIVGCNRMDLQYISENSLFRMIAVDVRDGKIIDAWKGPAKAPKSCRISVDTEGNYLNLQSGGDTAVIAMHFGVNRKILFSQSLSNPERRSFWAYDAGQNEGVGDVYCSTGNIVFALWMSDHQSGRQHAILRAFDKSSFGK